MEQHALDRKPHLETETFPTDKATTSTSMVIILVHIPKWHLDQFSSFCTAHITYFLYFTMDCEMSTKKVEPGPYLIHGHYSSQQLSKDGGFCWSKVFLHACPC